MELSIINFMQKSTVHLAKQGNTEAFSELIHENKLSMYKVAKAMLGRECDVEDAIQNTIINSYKNIKNLKKEKFFKTWLIRILINECNKIIKNNKKFNLLDYNQGVREEGYLDSYIDLDIHNAINDLDEELKETVILFYFDDFSIKDIARIMNVKVGTVKTRLLRARNKLGEIILKGEEGCFDE